MPHSHFFILSEEKRTRILTAAKNEFIQYSFYEASINRIIKAAGISRGAFYLYFEDKEDLFIYLMDGYKEKIFQEIIRAEEGRSYDLFAFGMLLYDAVTEERMDPAYKKILEILLTKIDLHLINHCINLQNETLKLKVIRQYIQTDNLSFEEDEALIGAVELVVSAAIIEMIYVSSGKKERADGRRQLERKYQLLRQGLLR